MELYEFYVGDTTYRYCSGARDAIYNGNTYTAEAISRGEINKEFLSYEASITMPQNLMPAPLFRITNPAMIILVNILKNNGTRLFSGQIDSCSFALSQSAASMKLTSIQSIMKSKIPTRTFSVSCPFELFDSGCALDKTLFGVNVTDASLDLTKTKLSSEFLRLGDGYFSGGYIDTGEELDYIISHAEDTLTLLYPLQNSVNQIRVYPGCDKTRAVCKTKFNNERNYGGCPFIPSKNPATEGF